jgi:hypothetical protein
LNEKHSRARKRGSATPRFCRAKLGKKHRGFEEATGGADELHEHIFFHPDCDVAASRLAATRTVGLGISPNLLTSSPGGEERSRARGLRHIPPVGNSTPP